MGPNRRPNGIMAISIAAIASSVRKRFVDTFIRTNTSGSLGASSDGSLWNATKGTFTVSSNKATAATTDYQIATQKMPYPNGDVNLAINDISQGSGAAIWVTDSGNWWAVGADSGAGVSCNCSTCYNTATYTPGNVVYVAGNINAPYSYQTGCTTCYNAGNAIYRYQSSNGACAS
jgi:hypothetical protein